MPLNQVYIGLGSNLGDRINNLRRSIELLESTKAVIITQASAVYENRAIGIEGGSDFYNGVIELYTNLSPLELLECCQGIERAMGRKKSDIWINRIIDIDLLAFGAHELESERLNLPHKEIFKRDFVLKPLNDIADSLEIKGQRIQEYVATKDLTGLKETGLRLWPTNQINQIVAVSDNGVIGNSGTLPWSIKEDWEIFLKKTKRGVLIMGRLSFDEMLKEKDWADERFYIVLSKGKALKINKNVEYAQSIEEALVKAKSLNKTIWICGGAAVYEKTFEVTEKLHLTRIHEHYQGDTFFPSHQEFFPHKESQISSKSANLNYTFEIWSH